MPYCIHRHSDEDTRSNRAAILRVFIAAHDHVVVASEERTEDAEDDDGKARDDGTA